MSPPPGSAPSAPRVAALASRLEEPPRGGPVDRALWGAGQVLAAARLVAVEPRLRAAALPPTLLTLAASAIAAALVASQDESAGFFQAAFAAFVALASMPPTLLHPLWLRVAMEARAALGAEPGERERPGEGYLAMLAREGAKALRQALLVAIGIAPVAVAVEALPFVGHGATVALGAAWAFYWVVVDAFEIPMELRPGKLGRGEPPWFERLFLGAGRRSRLLFLLTWAGRLSGRLASPWRHECGFTERHPAVSAGLGAAGAGVLALPVVGVFFRAVSITAATAALVRTGEAGRVAGELQPP